ncbi:HAD-like domain-containing protein [Hypoxylon sp. FL0890]|nr:HAD-like domain-containing protein [Hypoxylon sp. FL0890]
MRPVFGGNVSRTVTRTFSTPAELPFQHISIAIRLFSALSRTSSNSPTVRPNHSPKTLTSDNQVGSMSAGQETDGGIWFRPLPMLNDLDGPSARAVVQRMLSQLQLPETATQTSNFPHDQVGIMSAGQDYGKILRLPPSPTPFELGDAGRAVAQHIESRLSETATRNPVDPESEAGSLSSSSYSPPPAMPDQSSRSPPLITQANCACVEPRKQPKRKRNPKRNPKPMPKLNPERNLGPIPKSKKKDPKIPPSAASGGIPEPTEQYLTESLLPPFLLPKARPLLVVIDLNGTLLHRPSSHRPTYFIERPFARVFLRYCIKTFKVVIWSSAKPFNVEKMCNQLLKPEELSQVVAIWGRDRFGLSPEDYNQRVLCYKRLSKLWDDKQIAASHPEAALGKRWGQDNTVLVDDSIEKARSEPYNLIAIPEFKGDAREKGFILPQVHDYINECSRRMDVSTFIRNRPFKVNPDFTLEYDLPPQSLEKPERVSDDYKTQFMFFDSYRSTS